jgi:hypothetical protein
MLFMKACSDFLVFCILFQDTDNDCGCPIAMNDSVVLNNE